VGPISSQRAQSHASRSLPKLRKAGASLREIVEATGLSLRTVRTIVGRAEGTDRTTKRTSELRRLELHRSRMAAYRARKRIRDALPKRINEFIKRGKDLMKRARNPG
jgi:transposase